MKKDLILIGGGGHCKACIDVIEQTRTFEISGIVDNSNNVGKTVLGYPIVATDNDLPKMVSTYKYFFITIGQIKTYKIRKDMFIKLKKLGAIFPTIISPLAHVSDHASIGEGSIIMHNAIINPDATVGQNCIINTKAIIEHDVCVGDHCHISTGTILNGGSKVCSGTFVGSGTVVRECITIGENSLIGLCEAIKHPVAANTIITSSSRTSLDIQ